MNNITLVGTILLTVGSFSAIAQATNSTQATSNGTTASASQNGLSGASGKNESGARARSAKSATGDSGSISISTVDGSTNGSATNDGASGQSGSPVANQSAAFNQKIPQPKNSNSRRMKRSNSQIKSNSKATNNKSIEQ